MQPQPSHLSDELAARVAAEWKHEFSCLYPITTYSRSVKGECDGVYTVRIWIIM